MADVPENNEVLDTELEKSELEEIGPSVDFSDKKKILPKNFLLYSIALLWSFFLVFIFIYYMSYRNQKINAQDANEQSALQQDSASVIADSTQLALIDSIGEKPQSDSIKKFYIPPEGFLTTEDEMKILKLENGRRKREIDYLWNELRVLRKNTKTLEEKTLVAESQKDKKKTTPPAATSMLNERQKKLTQEKLEEEKRLKIQAEKEQKEKALSASAKLYSNMKPKMAATILGQFDDKEVAFMLKKLRERQAAKILEQMETSKAIQICKLMAK